MLNSQRSTIRCPGLTGSSGPRHSVLRWLLGEEIDPDCKAVTPAAAGPHRLRSPGRPGPFPGFPLARVGEPWESNLQADPGGAQDGSGAQEDQLGTWVGLSGDDTREESRLPLPNSHPRMRPPPTSIASHWPLVGAQQVENLFFFIPQPPKLHQGTEMTARRPPLAGKLVTAGRGTRALAPGAAPVRPLSDGEAIGGWQPEVNADAGEQSLLSYTLMGRAARRWLAVSDTNVHPRHFPRVFLWGRIF